MTRDAAKYAYIAKEISENNHWFRLTIMGEPYNQKPQLLFWLSAISFKIFGTSNFTYKLPIFLYSLLGCFFTFKLGESLYNKKTGLITALISLLSVIFLLYNMDIHTDTVLFTNTALSLWMLHKYLKHGKIPFLIGSGVALGLSVLTKGTFGVFMPFVSAVAYLLSKRKFSKLLIRDFFIGVLIILAVSLAAIIPFYAENGFKGVWFFLWGNNFGRIAGRYGGVSTDYFFYIHNILYLTLPWGIFLLSGMFYFTRDLIRKKFTPDDHFVFWGFAFFFLLLSISKNKLPNYIISALPLLSIIASKGWEEIVGKEKNRIIALHRVVLFLFISLIFIIPVLILQTDNTILWGILYITAILGFLLVRAGSTEKTLLLKTMFSMLVIALFFDLYLSPKLFNLQGAPETAKIIDENSTKEEKVYYLRPDDIEDRDSLLKICNSSDDKFAEVLTKLHFYRNYELMFYCQKKITYIEKIEQIPDIISNGKAWIYTDSTGMSKLEQLIPDDVSVTAIPNFDLKNPIKYMNPKSREKSINNMYLVHLE